jgi:hypothetical protein
MISIGIPLSIYIPSRGGKSHGTTLTPLEVPLAVDTSLDGFGILQALASEADAGFGTVVHVTTSLETMLGLTIGLIAYLRRLGIETARLEEDYVLSGPRASPQYLHLADVEVTGASAPPAFHALRRVRIAEVSHCVIAA